MSKEKRPYISPRVSSYKSADELPAKLRSAAEERLHMRSSLKVTVDENWRNVSVSEEFPGDLAQYVLVPGSRITMILNAKNSLIAAAVAAVLRRRGSPSITEFLF